MCSATAQCSPRPGSSIMRQMLYHCTNATHNLFDHEVNALPLHQCDPQPLRSWGQCSTTVPMRPTTSSIMRSMLYHCTNTTHNLFDHALPLHQCDPQPLRSWGQCSNCTNAIHNLFDHEVNALPLHQCNPQPLRSWAQCSHCTNVTHNLFDHEANARPMHQCTCSPDFPRTEMNTNYPMITHPLQSFPFAQPFMSQVVLPTHKNFMRYKIRVLSQDIYSIPRHTCKKKPIDWRLQISFDIFMWKNFTSCSQEKLGFVATPQVSVIGNKKTSKTHKYNWCCWNT
jgi:hypothetical protein